MAELLLPEPHFIDRDPEQVRVECLAKYEAETGRAVVPAQFEAQIIDLIAYRESLIRIAIQEAAKQNLPTYARFPMIDHLGGIVGLTRLEAQPARTMVRFALESPLGVATPIQEGTRVRTKDGRVTFATDADAVIPAGETTVDVGATAIATGPIGNGYLPGQVVDIVDQLDAELAATNLTTTSGGAASEDTERLRVRFPLAVQALSGAGPEEAYTFHAKSAHPDVVDVSVSTPEPGVVLLTVLARDGAPSPELLNLVEEAVSSRKVRPLCDTVQVQAASAVEYEIKASVTLRRGAVVDAVLADAEAKAAAYALDRASGLGRVPVPSQIIAALSVTGVYSVELLLPAPTPVAGDQWAQCTGVDVTFAGFAEGE